jgi:putative FmdB family regulatory protein
VPTYQYTCTDCGEPVEALQKFTDPPLSVCAACGGRLRKVFSPVGIVFKGSGFYRTDNRNGSSTLAAEKAEKAEKKDKQSSDSGSSTASTDSASSNGSAEKSAKKSESMASSKSSSSSEKVA